jgi:uncharacterized membrane protein YqaE (UPF0057 family)
MTILKIVLAVLFPPLSVFLDSGVGMRLILNIVLTLIGWLPGVIHALWVISSHPEPVHA